TSELYTLSLHDALPISELADYPCRLLLVIDDVHELMSDGAQRHLSRLLAELPESVHAMMGNAPRSSVAPSSTPTCWRGSRPSLRSEEHTSELQSRGHLV